LVYPIVCCLSDHRLLYGSPVKDLGLSEFWDWFIVSAKPGILNWTDTEILHLANRYGASREALLRRLLTIGRTTEAFYQAKRKQYQEEYQAIKKESGGGFSPPHTKAISSSGYLFVRLVLDNYRQDTITAGDVADFLEIRLKHLNKIEAAVLKPA
jgi:hypothetical protein